MLLDEEKMGGYEEDEFKSERVMEKDKRKMRRKARWEDFGGGEGRLNGEDRKK